MTQLFFFPFTRVLHSSTPPQIQSFLSPDTPIFFFFYLSPPAPLPNPWSLYRLLLALVRRAPAFPCFFPPTPPPRPTPFLPDSSMLFEPPLLVFSAPPRGESLLPRVGEVFSIRYVVLLAQRVVTPIAPRRPPEMMLLCFVDLSSNPQAPEAMCPPPLPGARV